MALVLLVFFAFNKQAFCNYYYFVIGALCTALAASSSVERLPQKLSAESNVAHLVSGTRG